MPLIQHWLGRVPGLGDESADLAQEVLVVIFRELPRFDRRREGSFRAWLRQVKINKVRNYIGKRERRPAVGTDAANGFLERPVASRCQTLFLVCHLTVGLKPPGFQACHADFGFISRVPSIT